MDDFQDANHKRPQMSSNDREQDGPPTDANVEVQRLQQGLDALDGLFPASRPSSAWFDQQIAAVQKSSARDCSVICSNCGALPCCCSIFSS